MAMMMPERFAVGRECGTARLSIVERWRQSTRQSGRVAQESTEGHLAGQTAIVGKDGKCSTCSTAPAHGQPVRLAGRLYLIRGKDGEGNTFGGQQIERVVVDRALG